MTVTQLDFNQWRADYDTMTFADHQAFNAACRDQYPDQRSFNVEACGRFLAAREPKTIVELGGWDGGLADAMLGMFAGIQTWLNYDITPDVPQTCGYAGYDRIVLDDWPWNHALKADALIASHVFEHMRMQEVEWLLDAWDVTSVFVDCPISGPPNWDGYHGTHILETSVHEFLTRLDDKGWTVTHSEPGLVAFLDRSRP